MVSAEFTIRVIRLRSKTRDLFDYEVHVHLPDGRTVHERRRSAFRSAEETQRHAEERARVLLEVARLGSALH